MLKDLHISLVCIDNFFEHAHIQLEVPRRFNRSNWEPFHNPLDRLRKRVEIDFSQLTAQFSNMRNFVKQYVSIFARIISKVSAFIVSQYLNNINNRPVGRIKYALA